MEREEHLESVLRNTTKVGISIYPMKLSQMCDIFREFDLEHALISSNEIVNTMDAVRKVACS